MIIEMIIGDLILNEIGVIHETCIVSDFWLNLRALKFGALSMVIQRFANDFPLCTSLGLRDSKH